MISIIVPVYNASAYLKNCINSIIKQTYSCFELILVDDGSTDDSLAIEERFQKVDQRIKVIPKENGGQASARNIGIAAASGQFFTFVDADDCIHPQCLEILYKALIQDQSDVAMAHYHRFNNDSELSSNKVDFNHIKSSKRSGYNTLLCLFDTRLDQGRYNSPCCKLIKSELLYDLRFPEGRIFEDEVFAFQLYDKCSVISELDIDLYFYRNNSQSTTNTLTLEKYFDEYEAQVERIAFFRKKGYDTLLSLGLNRFLHDAQWHMLACEKPREDLDEQRRLRFRQQYRDALREAEARELVSFRENYDYYVIAYPERKTQYRIKRIINRIK